MADLAIEIAGLSFRNPVLPAAGPNCRDAARVAECAAGGAGGLLTKTISVRAAEVPTPNMAELAGRSLINAELWSELSPEEWLRDHYPRARATAEAAGLPLGVSLGYTAEEIRYLAPRVAPFADYLELSTHYLEGETGPVQDAIAAAREGGQRPVFLKLSPLAGRDLVALARAAEEAGAAALVAVNSFGPALAIDIERGRPRLGGPHGYGWISGAALKPIALRVVYELAQVTRLPVIGVGGVQNGRDAVEMLMAGASAVGVSTAAILQGNGIYGRIAAQLGRWLDEHGAAHVWAIRGRALPPPGGRVRTTTAALQALSAPRVRADACTGCDLCRRSCFYDAIVPAGPRLVAVEEAACYRCGLCYSRCPVAAIEPLEEVAP
ncbi:MAG: diguanylate cyclase [Firmicutes bacterium]|nr:diguanylate cyclase [Bacillota bacterium]